jgi:hypothetical protein
MKKPLLVLFSFGLLTLFFACQKSNNVAPLPDSPDGEILSCGRGGGAQEPPPTLECGQFRTQSQGGWGAYPYGNNSGTYLHAHFSDAFPAGLKIGCDENGHSISFTSAASITKFLPSSGYPSILSVDVTDPQYGAVRSVLAGQVTALALNVGFDFYDEDFSPAEEKLGNLSIVSGPFAGKSVSEFLSIANAVLGGCSTDYSAAAVSQAASAINANFLDGKMNGGYLSCPASRFAER